MNLLSKHPETRENLSRMAYSDEDYDYKYYRSFTDIFNHIRTYEEEESKDEVAIHIIHYLFQAITDWLIRTEITERYWMLEHVINHGKKYMASFYTGEPNHQHVKELLYLEEGLEGENDNYRYKERGNWSSDGLRREHVHEWVKDVLDYYMPDVIVGIASSACEQTMTLSALTGIPVVYVRYSKRRGDGMVHIIPGSEQIVKNAVKGYKVLVCDDYLQYGVSLTTVMNQIKEMGATEVVGSTIKGPTTDDLERTVVLDRMRIYTFKTDNNE